MPVSINNTTLTFNDATTQTTAPVNTNANVTSATAVAGTGISVTAVTTTGAATHTVTNTGVTSVTAGSGISVSASTGGVTISAAAVAAPQIQKQAFYSSGSWTAPTGVTRVAITCVAGGGGGCLNYSNVGGNGGFAIGGNAVVTPGTSYAVTVGGGGSGNYGAGNPGGASSFGSLVSATGGGGGPNSPSTASQGTGTVSSGNRINTGSIADTYGLAGVHPFYNYGKAGGYESPGTAGAVLIEWVGL